MVCLTDKKSVLVLMMVQWTLRRKAWFVPDNLAFSRQCLLPDCWLESLDQTHFYWFLCVDFVPTFRPNKRAIMGEAVGKVAAFIFIKGLSAIKTAVYPWELPEEDDATTEDWVLEDAVWMTVSDLCNSLVTSKYIVIGERTSEVTVHVYRVKKLFVGGWIIIHFFLWFGGIACYAIWILAMSFLTSAFMMVFCFLLIRLCLETSITLDPQDLHVFQESCDYHTSMQSFCFVLKFLYLSTHIWHMILV